MLKKQNIMKGVIFSIFGYFCIAMMSACAKALPHLPLTTLVGAQCFIGLLFSLPTVLRQGVGTLKTEHPWLIMLRAATGLLSLCAMFTAMHYIPLVNVVLLQNTLPLFVPLVMLIAMKKGIQSQLWFGLVIGFIGVLLIIKPNIHIVSPGALIGLSAGLLSAISVVTIAKLKQTESTSTMSFYFLLMGTLASAPFAIMHWVPLNFSDLLLLIGLGFFTYVGQMSITHAFLYGPPHALAPLSYAAVIFTGLLGWALWGHVPDWLSFVGIVCVIVGGVLTIILDRADVREIKLKHLSIAEIDMQAVKS